MLSNELIAATDLHDHFQLFYQAEHLQPISCYRRFGTQSFGTWFCKTNIVVTNLQNQGWDKHLQPVSVAIVDSENYQRYRRLARLWTTKHSKIPTPLLGIYRDGVYDMYLGCSWSNLSTLILNHRPHAVYHRSIRLWMFVRRSTASSASRSRFESRSRCLSASARAKVYPM